MNTKKFAIASGFTSVVIYILCFLIMNILGKNALVEFSNLLFHGMNFETIINMEISIIDSIIGLILSFLFWGFVGYLLSSIYNYLYRNESIEG